MEIGPCEGGLTPLVQHLDTGLRCQYHVAKIPGPPPKGYLHHFLNHVVWKVKEGLQLAVKKGDGVQPVVSPKPRGTAMVVKIVPQRTLEWDRLCSRGLKPLPVADADAATAQGVVADEIVLPDQEKPVFPGFVSQTEPLHVADPQQRILGSEEGAAPGHTVSVDQRPELAEVLVTVVAHVTLIGDRVARQVGDPLALSVRDRTAFKNLTLLCYLQAGIDESREIFRLGQ